MHMAALSMVARQIRKERFATLCHVLLLSCRSYKYQARYRQLWIGICCKQSTDNVFIVNNIRLHFEHATVASPKVPNTFRCAVRYASVPETLA